MSRHSLFAALAAFLTPAAALAQPLTTTFTYQGELKNGASLAAGAHDFRFRLYDATTGGTQLGPTLCLDNVALTSGRFSVSLDFGAQFAGQRRYLEIEARQDSGLDCTNTSGFTLLSPRQELTITPNAAFALTTASAATATNSTQLNGQPASFYQNASNLTTGTLPSAQLAGAYSAALTLSNAANAISGNGAGLSSLNATNLSTGLLPDARLSTNVPRLNSANAFGAFNNTFAGLVGVGTASPTSALHAVRNWDGEDGTLRLDGDKPTIRFTGGSAAGNLNWLLHVGSDGPGNLGLFQRVGTSGMWFNPINFTPQGTMGIGVTTTNFRPIWTKTSVIYPAHFESTHTLATALEIGNTSNGAVWEFGLAGTGAPFGLTSGSMYLFKQSNNAPAFSIAPNGFMQFTTGFPAQMTFGYGGTLAIHCLGGGSFESNIQIYNGNDQEYIYLGSLAGAGTRPLMGVLNPTAGTGVLRAGFKCDFTNQGVVFGDSKQFRIENPRKPGTDIAYACIEGPEVAAYVRGTGHLVNGRATIQLPEHFQDVAISEGLTVQLTPCSAQSLGLAVTSQSTGHFEVAELLRGTGTYDFHWRVEAVRKGYEKFEVIRPTAERTIGAEPAPPPSKPTGPPPDPSAPTSQEQTP